VNYAPVLCWAGLVPVSDRSEQLRQAAAECLRRARDTRDDPGARAALLILARKSLELADSLAEKNRNTVALNLNDHTPHFSGACNISKSDRGT
jgi:hypothetical protein